MKGTQTIYVILTMNLGKVQTVYLHDNEESANEEMKNLLKLGCAVQLFIKKIGEG